MENFPGETFESSWEIVETRRGCPPPCQRSLHAGAVWKDNFVVFGGYNGQYRVNDTHAYVFTTGEWSELPNANAPSARDRHTATVYEDHLYIFGGFDGLARVNGMIIDLILILLALIVYQSGL